MNRPLIRTCLPVFIVTLSLAACEGESRAFEEAVEIRELNIRSLDVVAPDTTLDELILNIGESIEFGIQGLDTASQPVQLDARDRHWQVSDPAVARIDEDGRLVALANGDVSVSVEVGGVASSAYALRVSDATLIGVDSILGDSIVERCLPSGYQARGLYDDGTVRDLTDVNWTLADEDSDDARISNSAGISVELTGLNVSSVTLTAARDGFSEAVSVEISDSLVSLDITPESATLDVNETASFVATGTYNGMAPDGEGAEIGNSRQVNVTAAVDWRIDSGSSYASVSNAADTKGQVSGQATGSATLNAACGSLDATAVVITVIDSVVDSLAFSQGTTYELDPDDSDGVTLLVSSGTSYSASRRLDNDDLEWEFTRSGTVDAIELTEDGDDAGLIVPLVESGVGTVTVTHPDGASASIIIEVTDA